MSEKSPEHGGKLEKDKKFMKTAVHAGALVLGGIVAINLLGAGLHNLGAALHHPFNKL